jgi:hypothetical protein
MIWVATRGHPPDATDEKRTDNAAQDDDEEEGVVVDHVAHHPQRVSTKVLCGWEHGQAGKQMTAMLFRG